MRKIYTVTALLLMTLPLQGCLGVKIVDTGQRGVRVVWGKAEPEILAEGFYLYNPFSTTIIQMDTRTETYTVEAESYTKDVQQAKMKVVVNYNLNKDKAAEMYQNVGSNWADKLIPQAVQGALKGVIGQWEAVDLVANRNKAVSAIAQGITERLAAKDVTVTGVEVTNIDYTPEFEKAVEEKVVAIQNAETAKNNTVQVSEKAHQIVITAKADAEAMQIKSQALSQNQNLVAYEAVQKWDGKLPVQMFGAAVPFINVPK